MLELDKKIIKIVNSSNYEKGKNINPENILPQKTLTILGNDKIYKYKVESANNDNIYIVELIIKNGEIISSNCTCPMCEKTGSCKHIAAVLLKHGNDIFPGIKKETKNTSNKISLSKQIIDELCNRNSISINKKMLKLELELNFARSYNRKGVYVTFKLGLNKLYSTNQKIGLFLSSYKNHDEVIYFGKEFTFDPNSQYFNEEDEKILNYLYDIYYLSGYSNYNAPIFIEEKFVSSFMNLLNTKTFRVYPYYEFNGILDSNPFNSKLTMEDGLYTFELEMGSDYHYLDYSHDFITVNDKLYRVSKNLKDLLTLFHVYNTNSITFEKNDLNKFVKGMDKLINDNISIDDDIKDEFIMINPKVHLYFDFDEEIICDIKFEYNKKMVNYLDITNDFLRNNVFEQGVIDDILSHRFILNNKVVQLEDIDNYDYFIENVLPYLSEKYEIYTTEKFDKIDIKKNTNITSHFSIGQDNIFRIDFDLDGIDQYELRDIFDGISHNKKYYKLKNGSLLNLQDKNLNEFKNLVDDTNLDVYNSLDYVIPKYRTIYLDSLKESKYNIIKTNNLFDEFIDNFKKYKDVLLNIDDKVLRNYQVIGVKWLYNIYKCGFGGILADEMGLGKSIQVIYLIKQILKENSSFKILIVAPTSLIYNWENEFNKFGSELKYKVIAGNKQSRKKDFDNILDINILITTYGLVREDSEYYEKMNFELMIIDEAQNIKNPHAASTKIIKKLNSNVRIALTGTPLENSIIELWSIFDFIMPGYLNNLDNFIQKYNVKDIDKDTLSRLDNLNLQISPFILRRKKTDVLKDLPPKIENTIYLDLGQEQKLMYVKEVKRTEKEMDEIISTEGFLKARFKILSLITRLRQICIDPSIVYPDYSDGAIKIEEVCNTVKKIINDNHKILIFTSYKKALEIVRNRLDEENISSYVIDGSVSSKKRNELVTNFNNDNTNVFLIMLKAGGTGLNLTGADVVIHLDLWWNPQAENQATDRAHRIGQKNTVQVIKFVCKGTIEERILELQNKKKILSDTLIEGESRDENIISSLNEEDFRRLLSYSGE